MKIHNKLKITKGETVFESFNNLLLPALEAIRDFKPYNNFLAIGTGNSETKNDMKTLEKFAVALPLVTDKFNFDPQNGTLFITKKLVLDENNRTPLEIVEVGLTYDGESENPPVANRFLANNGAPIFRDKGEEMTIEVTLYLELSEESGFLKLTAGSNNLVKLFLGGGSEGVFSVAKGEDLTANDTLIERNEEGLVLNASEVSGTLDEENNNLTFNIIGDLGSGLVNEFLLVLDGKVVARENVKECDSGEEIASTTKKGDYDNLVVIEEGGIKNIESVVKTGDGSIIEGFTIRNYATNFSGEWEESLKDKGYTKNTPRFISKKEDMIAFILDDHLDVFDFRSGVPVEIDTSAVDITGAYLYLIFDNLFNMCLRVFCLGFILFGTLWVSWTWVIISFPILGTFSTIISQVFSHRLSFCLLLLGLL